MAKKAFGSLSSKGMITDTAGRLEQSLAVFYVSDYNQTNLFPGMVASLPKIMQESSHKTVGVMGSLESTLQSYLAGVFDNVKVTVTSSDLSDETVSRNTVEVLFTISDNGREEVIARLLPISESALTKMMKHLNDGIE